MQADEPNLETFGGRDALGHTMNSGFTKIFALRYTGLAMYDSRVAGALGFLAVRYSRSCGLPMIPDELAFRIPPGQGILRRTDPSDGVFGFRATGGSLRHALWNVRANWILGALARCDSPFFDGVDQDQRIRCLEASLFMIGYDVRPEHLRIPGAARGPFRRGAGRRRPE
jgi:hypothetical protein